MAAVTFMMNFSTLMPVLLGVTLTRFVVMGHYVLHRKVYPGFRTFVLAEFCALLSMSFIFLRSSMGEALLLMLLTGLGSFAQQIIAYHGLGVYCRLPRLWARTRQNMLLAAVAGLALSAEYIFSPDIMRRVMIYSAVSLVICLRVGLEIPLLGRRVMAGVTLLCATFLLGAALHGARGWSMLGAVGYDYSADPILTYLLLFRTLQSVLEFYVVFSMNSQLLEVDLRAATAQVAHMAQTDSLTGVLNRRGLQVLGAEALRKSLSQGRPASVIMLDLDHFKRVNDTLGHVAGDELLRDVAALCQGSLRGEDVFARYGGEEFVVVVPFSDVREARQLAERMRQAVETTIFSVMQGQFVTASFGVASARKGNLQALLRCADEALYAAKRAGRNRVVLALGPDEAAQAGEAAPA